MAMQPKKRARRKDDGSNPPRKTDRDDQGRRDIPRPPAQRDRDADEPTSKDTDRDDDR
jgi:hypothetical protein